jgi:peptidoglycan/LPS O-acetylase OafA/YrhL
MTNTDRPDGGDVVSGSRPSRQSVGRWGGLDGLRAVAVIAVVWYHFRPSALSGGLLGVDVFFVISGYLITRMITTEFYSAGRIDRLGFYRRRARRLFPALAVLLVAVSVAALVWRDQLATVRAGVFFSAIFGANWWLALDHQSYFVAAGRPSMLQHLWSLGIEEQFYLIWPLLAVAILKRATRDTPDSLSDRDYVKRGVVPLAIVAGSLALISTGLMWVLADVKDVPYGDASSLYYGTETHCMGLLLGAALGALAVIPRAPGWWSKNYARTLEAVGILAFIGVLLCLMDFTQSSYHLFRGGFLLVSFLVCVVIAASTQPHSRIGLTLDWAPLRWVGVRSYSIYLWHWPIADVSRPGIDTTMPTWLDQLIRISLTIVLADLSYRLVETPMRRNGIRATLLSWAKTIRAQLAARKATFVTVGAGGFAVLIVLALGVLLIGPSAPAPASADSGPGGLSLAITPGPEPTTSSPPGKHHRKPVDTKLPAVSGYGDSVLLDARHDLGQLFDGGSIDAVIGRQPGPILADVRAAAKAHALNPVVIIHAGNNGLIRASDLEQTLQLLQNPASGARVVLVLTDHIDPYDNSWQKPNNKTINRVVPNYPNAHVVQWDRLASEHHSWLYPDDLHLRPDGATAYAQILASAYRSAVKDQNSS